MSLLIPSHDKLSIEKIIAGESVSKSLDLIYCNTLELSNANNSYHNKSFIDSKMLPNFIAHALGRTTKYLFKGHLSKYVAARVKSYRIDGNCSHITLVDLAEILSDAYLTIIMIDGNANNDMVIAYEELMHAIDMKSTRRRNFRNRPLPAH